MSPLRSPRVLRNPGHLGPGMARCIRKEQLRLQIHFDCFRVDPRRWPFWRGSLPRQEEGWAGHLTAQPGPGFMGHWVAVLASPGLSFSICNMGIFLLSQPLCLVRKTPLSTGPRILAQDPAPSLPAYHGLATESSGCPVPSLPSHVLIISLGLGFAPSL